MIESYEVVFVNEKIVARCESNGYAHVKLPSGDKKKIKDAEVGWMIFHSVHGWIGPFQDKSSAYDLMGD